MMMERRQAMAINKVMYLGMLLVEEERQMDSNNIMLEKWCQDWGK